MQNGYGGVCSALLARFEKRKDVPLSAESLVNYAAVRFAKIGTTLKDGFDYGPLFHEYGETLAGRLRSEENIPGETIGAGLVLHGGAGAGWLCARGERPDFADKVAASAEKLTADAHRTEQGLFDNPAYPGHVSAETPAAVCPYLAWAGKITGRGEFFDEAAAQFLGHYEALYDKERRLWHPGLIPGRIAPAMWAPWSKNALAPVDIPDRVGLMSGFWGRGAGYAAYAVSELLFELPKEHREYEPIAAVRRDMMDSLLQYQDRSGMWHQALNDFGSYPETSATGWILYAMGRGIKRGTLDREKFIPAYLRGLAGVCRYIGFDGSVFNGCSRCVCPGGRGTNVDFALHSWEKDAPDAFAPLLLAFQQAAQIEIHAGLIPPFQELQKEALHE